MPPTRHQSEAVAKRQAGLAGLMEASEQITHAMKQAAVGMETTLMVAMLSDGHTSPSDSADQVAPLNISTLLWTCRHTLQKTASEL